MLQVFRSLPIVHAVHRRDTLPASAHGYTQDTITLGWEERLKARGRRRSDGGVEFGTTLPRGAALREGDCLVLEGPAVVVTVVERPEPVLIVEPRTAAEWGLYAYYIGNSHHPVMIADRGLVCPDGPGMEQVLLQHGIAYSRSNLPFTPVGLLLDHRH